MTFYEEMLTLNYFSITTLSTIGFGDYEPRSNIERLYMAFGMLLGVAVFSSILSNFIDMLNTIKDFLTDYENGS
jgi:voltage-gated potassium channel